MIFKGEDEHRTDRGIYRIVDLVTNGQYIGQAATGFSKRFWSHRHQLNKGTHYNKKLQEAWDRDGGDNFVFEVLVVENDDDDLRNRLEREYIADARRDGECYNHDKGGGVMHGHWSMTDEQKKAIAERNRLLGFGRKASDETKAKMRRHSAHTPPTEEHKKKLSEFKKNYVVKESTKKKLSDMYQGELSLTAKITNKQAAEVKQMLMAGYKMKDVAAELGVSMKAVSFIATDRTFKRVYVPGWDEYVMKRLELHADRKTDGYWGRLLDREAVERVQSLLMQEKTLKDVSAITHVGIQTVSAIAAGRTYTDIAIDGWSEYLINRKKLGRSVQRISSGNSRNVTKSQVVDIKRDLVSGVTQRDIAKKYGIGIVCVRMISYGTTHKDVIVPGWEEYLQNRERRKNT